MALKSDPDGADRRNVKWLLRIIGILVLLLALIPAAYVSYTQSNGNFHVVEAGQVYRSAELPPARLARIVKQYGIRSVLNLEGAKPGKPWYESEVGVLRDLGVERDDFRLSATAEPPPERVAELVDLMRRAPKPMLIHCHDGADRTGLAAALYEAKILGRDSNEADRQLSLRYGHFEYLGSDTRVMDDAYWAAVGPDDDTRRGDR
jgi:protein tyrosine/serine phosphatase